MPPHGIDLKPIATAAKSLSKPLVKLLDVVQNGIGALGGPLVMILNAHGKGRANLIREGYKHRLRLMQARNAQELEAATGPAPLLPSSNEDLGIDVVFEAAEDSEQIATRFMETHQSAKRRANVITIAAEAADSIGPEAADDPVDPDWVARFFTYAQDVSSEHLQRLWGRILAGEVERPGRVPLRTLEILRNLSQREASVVAKLASKVSSNSCYLPYGQEALTPEEVRLLRDAQIFEDSVGTVRWKVEADLAQSVLPFNEPPGSAELPYPSGHVIKLTAATTIYPVHIWVVRPSALPLINAAKPLTDLSYLEAVATALNSEEFIQAELI